MIATETCAIFHIYSARQKRDNDDEEALLSTFQRFNVFLYDGKSASLQNVATKDLATE
jgi:hypothetical protein